MYRKLGIAEFRNRLKTYLDEVVDHKGMVYELAPREKVLVLSEDTLQQLQRRHVNNLWIASQYEALHVEKYGMLANGIHTKDLPMADLLSIQALFRLVGTITRVLQQPGAKQNAAKWDVTTFVKIGMGETVNGTIKDSVFADVKEVASRLVVPEPMEYWQIAQILERERIILQDDTQDSKAKVTAANNVRSILETCLRDKNLDELTSIYKEKRANNPLGFDPLAVSDFVEQLLATYPPFDGVITTDPKGELLSNDTSLLATGVADPNSDACVAYQMQAAQIDKEIQILLKNSNPLLPWLTQGDTEPVETCTLRQFLFNIRNATFGIGSSSPVPTKGNRYQLHIETRDSYQQKMLSDGIAALTDFAVSLIDMQSVDHGTHWSYQPWNTLLCWFQTHVDANASQEVNSRPIPN